METAAHALEFDKAARYRDEIRRIESEQGIKESILPVSKGIMARGKKRSG